MPEQLPSAKKSAVASGHKTRSKSSGKTKWIDSEKIQYGLSPGSVKKVLQGKVMDRMEASFEGEPVELDNIALRLVNVYPIEDVIAVLNGVADVDLQQAFDLAASVEATVKGESKKKSAKKRRKGE
ncbi:hypothetical protein CLAFUW4_13249 [Fulvia fulva]|uniref:Tail assembly chaperone n=1 Tax=Passalora fulva TaxID=5499 RepID=A0A9Q8PJK9_PASFU|nr:uncharacterized protein CLAFUR5_13105 [Fulvia fulva]KAK4611949.1 hypothetical protein CLAFUR4_13254 [Fulvia fulva]KAK4612825.1 hypothetical protein CLAFUR0_13259 [Fulvia fulva]UJO23685.1 hypothetical protein CLAFUR5_13105 [Fulvia fulva]WPV21441.1 hypothetical protein CLAFUW4_13249 [Fulvia fulva]WPV36622.1 hypothetical protein CLAFUW7_13256 [Fulvia fulva]